MKKTTGIVASVCLCLLICAATATISSASGGTVLFEDDFDSGVMSPLWVSIKPSQWVENGWLHSEDTGPGRDSFAVVHDGNQDWTDYRMSFRLDPIDTHLYRWKQGQILFRTSDIRWSYHAVEGNYYRLSIFVDYSSEGPSIGLSRMNGGTHTHLFEDRSYPVQDRPMDVEIVVEGAHIQVWIDGDQVIDLIDPDPHLYGGVGIGSIWEAEARLDDVVVRSLGYSLASFDCDWITLGFSDEGGGQDSHRMAGSFALPSDSDGIDLLWEDVTIHIGTSEITIPGGSFERRGFRYIYDGAINGAAVVAQFEDLGSGRYGFDINAQSVDLTDTSNPVTLGLQIGNDSAETSERLPGWLGNRPIVAIPD